MSSVDWALWRVRMFATYKTGPMAEALQEQGTEIVKVSHSQAWHDVKTRWRRGLQWILYPGILIGLIFCLRYSAVAPYENDYEEQSACLPDGGFSLDHGTYNYWAASGLFQVTLGFGSLSFAVAKIIDVAWDIIIGRGGQAVLAILSWNVFAEYVTATMQTAPITFKTFRTMFIQKDISSLLGVTRLIRGFSHPPHKLPSKTAMVFMGTSMVFILAFPTFGSAMTGYSANVAAFVEDQANNYAPLDNYKQLYYTIEDGDKIVLSVGYQVAIDAPYFSSYGTYCYFSNGTSRAYECQLLDSVTKYILDYGIEGATNDTTTFGRFDYGIESATNDATTSGRFNKTISAPSLNIKVHFLPLGYLSPLERYYDRPGYNDSIYLVRTPSGEDLNLVDKNSTTWTNGGNSTYDHNYLARNGKCQPTLTYQWGFSYIQLILIICILICWNIGLYILYISANIAMHRNGRISQAPDDYQADIQLVKAMETQISKDLDEVEERETTQLSAKELKKCIEKDLKGGSMSNKDSLLETSDERSDVPAWRLRGWVRKEAFWLLLLIISVVGCILAVFQRPEFVLAHFAPLLLIFTMYVGQSWGSRVVLLVWSVLVVLIVSLPAWGGNRESRY